MLIRYWLKATNTYIAVAKYPIGQIPIFKEKIFQLFEDAENGPKITTLLPLNHRIDFRADSEY